MSSKSWSISPNPDVILPPYVSSVQIQFLSPPPSLKLNNNQLLPALDTPPLQQLHHPGWWVPDNRHLPTFEPLNLSSWVTQLSSLSPGQLPYGSIWDYSAGTDGESNQVA